MLTITHILFPLFIGMIIGGFAFGNNTIGIIGVVLAIVDAIVGIVITYFKNKGGNMSPLRQAQACYKKVQRLISNPNSREIFTIAELSSGVVNLLDASNVLTNTEYFYLQKIHNKYICDFSSIEVTYVEFLVYCDIIISNYDMVVPYYKICESSNLSFSNILEDEKQPYREKAKILIDHDKLFSSEWKSLNAKFYKEFYDADSE